MWSTTWNKTFRNGAAYFLLIFCGVAATSETALGQLPPTGVPPTGGGTLSDGLLPPSMFPKPTVAPPPVTPPVPQQQCDWKVVNNVVQRCCAAIDPKTPAICQSYAAMFQGQCNQEGEQCLTMGSECTGAAGTPFNHRFNMILDNKTGKWCLVEPQNGTYLCLDAKGDQAPTSAQLCAFHQKAGVLKNDASCKCKSTTQGDIGEIITPITAPSACAKMAYSKDGLRNAPDLSTPLLACLRCCNVAHTTHTTLPEFWLKDCEGACLNHGLPSP
jgi:hypothetical protein